MLRWRQNAKVLGPPELREQAESRLALLRDRHANGFEPAKTVDRPLREAPAPRPAPTAAARPRSAPSASPGWSPSPAC